MNKSYPGEQWKTIKFDYEYTNDFRMEISNFGRLRSFNQMSDGNIVNGSMVNGYRIIRLKLFRPRQEKMQKELDSIRLRIQKLERQIKTMTQDKQSKATINEAGLELKELKKKHVAKMNVDTKQRTIYYQSLIHRLVATYFLKKPAPDQNLVGHLDYNKLNNRTYNLKWMNRDENAAHQQHSPYVIAEKKDRHLNKNSRTTKLTVTKVMLLRKLLNQNKPIRQLAKQFKVTDTQIIRIRKGENWKGVEAAK